jgi:biopolymer transport protein ExbD
MPGYGYIRERRRPPEPSAKPQITSFADVTLVLLIIFLVSSSAAVQMVAAELPDAKNTMARDVNLAVTVSLTDQAPEVEGAEAEAEAEPAGEDEKKGDKASRWKFYFEDDTTGIEVKNLWTALKKIKGDNQWPLALVRADKDAPCEHVSILIQCLQGLGVDEIAFCMSTKDQHKKPGER